MAWRFYVYEIIDDQERIAYVGKGSGQRLRIQCSKFKMAGREVARFKRERDAYAFEIKHIASSKPYLNKHPGGNGSASKRTRRSNFEILMDKIGTRAMAARILLDVHRVAPHLIDTSKLDLIRQVAYGQRA